jgi:sporulation protein YlmC with PRC-barrel domain
MRLSELYGVPVRDLDGRKLGRLFEIYVIENEVEAIGCGAGTLFERLTGRNHGKRIPWVAIRAIGPRGIVIDPSILPSAWPEGPAPAGE